MKFTALSRGRGFTLLEMLVAVSVFGILMAMLAKMVFSASAVWTHTRTSSDNLSRARVAMDNLQIDLSKAILRPDLAAFVDATGQSTDSNGNAVVAFYAERPGISYEANQREIGLVSYTLTSDSAGNPILQRSVMPVEWGDTSLVRFGETDRLSQLGKGTTYSQEMAHGVLAWTVKYLASDGTVASTFSASNTRGVAASLLVIDDQTCRRLTDGQRRGLASEFQAEAGKSDALNSVESLWERKLDSGAFQTAHPGLAGSLKVFERTYTLPNSAQ